MSLNQELEKQLGRPDGSVVFSDFNMIWFTQGVLISGLQFTHLEQGPRACIAHKQDTPAGPLTTLPVTRDRVGRNGEETTKGGKENEGGGVQQ